MQFQNLPCPQICKLFHTVPFPGVVPIPTPGTFLVPLAVAPPTEWFKHFPGLLWATVNPSVCTIIFMNHAYLTRRTRNLLQGWGIVMFVLFSLGAVCGPVSSFGWHVLLIEQRDGLSPHVSHPLLHSWCHITKLGCGTKSPKCWVALLLSCHLSHHLGFSTICSLKQISPECLLHAGPMLGAELSSVELCPALMGSTV